MDKSLVNIEKIVQNDCRVHKCPAGAMPIHEDYGLRIVATRRKQNVQHGPDEKKFRYYEFYSLSHFLAGESFFQIEGEKKIFYKPGQGILMPPFVKHYYGPDQGVFTEDTICFTGNVADHLCRSGIIKPAIINIGKHRRLLPIMEMANDPSVNSQIMANFALQKLLIELYFEDLELKKDNHANEIRDILQMIQANPEKWWTVPELAKKCHLSDDQFRCVFRRETGWTPKLYIDKIKISKAAEELCISNRSVTEIAREYGYSDQYHFSRRFKQTLGISPDKYRRNH